MEFWVRQWCHSLSYWDSNSVDNVFHSLSVEHFSWQVINLSVAKGYLTTGSYFLCLNALSLSHSLTHTHTHTHTHSLSLTHTLSLSINPLCLLPVSLSEHEMHVISYCKECVWKSSTVAIQKWSNIIITFSRHKFYLLSC